MSHPPQLPETPPKRKNRSPLRVIVNAWGCLLSIIMLGIGAALGLVGATFFAPQILGFDATATALADDAIILASTQAEINFRASEAAGDATEFARDSDATIAALGNEEILIGQTATQSQRYIIATETAVAAENSRQLTQIALDYQATQVQLQENATAAEIDFRNTQAALGVGSSQRESQDEVDSAENTSVESQALAAQSVEEPTPADLPPTAQSAPTEVPTGVLLPASDTPSPTPESLDLRTDFSTGWDTQYWRSADYAAWEQTEQGAIAEDNGNWLLSAQSVQMPYEAEIAFQPAPVLDSAYDLLLNIGDDEGVALRMVTEGLTISQVEIYRFDVDLLDDGALREQDMVLLQRNIVSLPLTQETVIRVTVEDEQLTITLNGDTLLSVTDLNLAETGAVGVALPAEATLLHIAITEER